MPEIYVVTTSYPRSVDDAEGHFVGAEVQRLCDEGDVTVLAPGKRRPALRNERVVSLGGGGAFGFPGVLARTRQQPWQVGGAVQFVASALAWLRQAPTPARVIAHFLLPCGVPIATRGLGRRRGVGLEVVVHGSDARLFAQFPLGHGWVGRELMRAGAALRFVSNELQELVLGSLPTTERGLLQQRSRVEPCADRHQSGALGREAAHGALLLDIPRTGHARGRDRRAPGRGKRVHVALEACERVAGLCARSSSAKDRSETRLMARFPHALFAGQVERPLALAYVAAADALVSASLREGAPSWWCARRGRWARPLSASKPATCDAGQRAIRASTSSAER